MSIAEVVTLSIGVIGALAGAVGAYAGLRNANNGRENTLIQTAMFLQSEVRRLNDECDELRTQVKDFQRKERARNEPRKP